MEFVVQHLNTSEQFDALDNCKMSPAQLFLMHQKLLGSQLCSIEVDIAKNKCIGTYLHIFKIITHKINGTSVYHQFSDWRILPIEYGYGMYVFLQLSSNQLYSNKVFLSGLLFINFITKQKLVHKNLTAFFSELVHPPRSYSEFISLWFTVSIDENQSRHSALY